MATTNALEAECHEHDEDEDDEDDEELRKHFLTRLKTMVMGRSKVQASESASLGNASTLRACEVLMGRTKEFYHDLVAVEDVPALSPRRLKSFIMPEFTGPQETGDDPRFGKLKEFSTVEKKQVLRELSLAGAEEVDALPDVTPAQQGSAGEVLSPSRGGVKIVRAYYRQCQACKQTKPVGSFL